MEVSITYRDLIQARTEELRVSGKSEKTIQNAVSYLRRFMRTHECNELTVIGSEWDGDFSEVSGDDRGMRAALRAANKTYLKISESHGLPEDFSGALSHLIKASGMTVAELARHIGASPQTIHNWFIGKHQPNKRSLPLVSEIENFFGLSASALLDRVYIPCRNVRRPLREKPQTRIAVSDKEFHDDLREEFRDLLKFKTSPLPPRGMERNDEWRLRPLSSYGGKYNQLAAIDDLYCPSAGVSFERIRTFFGFLVQTKRVPLDKLSLAHLASIDFLQSYVDFLGERTGWTKYVPDSVNFLKALLNPKWGYIPQCGYLAERASFDIDESQWRSHCEAVFLWCGETLKTLNKSKRVRVGRNPFDRIKGITDKENPLEFLYLLYKRMSEIRPPSLLSPSGLAWARDRLLIALMITNPLRINQFKIMTYREDGSGHLRCRVENGKRKWSLHFEPNEFKNEDGAATHAYHASVPDWVGVLIDDYILETRPNLQGSKESDWVFLRSISSSNAADLPGREFMVTKLEEHFWKRTVQCLHDVVPQGFNPHAPRHIVATGMLKQGCTIDEVAAVLHDTVDMVRKHYGKLAATDGLRTLNRHLDKIRVSQNGSGASA